MIRQPTPEELLRDLAGDLDHITASPYRHGDPRGTLQADAHTVEAQIAAIVRALAAEDGMRDLAVKLATAQADARRVERLRLARMLNEEVGRLSGNRRHEQTVEILREIVARLGRE